ncbi:hypothetical protein ACLMJK_008405 [Lecanora helva]
MDDSIKATNEQGYAAYPPSVEKADVLGWVKDAMDFRQSRDIGVCSQFAGRTYLLFGDTFCFDNNNEFCGLVNNTASIVHELSNPTKAENLGLTEKGHIPPFIPLTEEEEDFEKKGTKTRWLVDKLGSLADQAGYSEGTKPFMEKMRENHCKKNRVALWAFGGLVELDDRTGRMWFQKTVFHGGEQDYVGTGVAKVMSTGDRGELRVERTPGLVFGPEDPRNGTFATIIDGEYVYLYGDSGSNNIVLARVKQTDDMLEKGHYSYWNGTEYVDDPKAAVTIFHNMCHGAVVRSKLFGSDRPFLFVGVNGWADSQVQMAASASLEGPWDPQPIYKAAAIDKEAATGFMYCMYPHIWASDEEKAELVVSWSEGYHGGVVMARLKLAPVAKDDA